MATYYYNYPAVLVPEDNLSLTQKRIIKPAPCEEQIPQELAGLWNNNLCSQDEPYCQPWVNGDIVYAQFKITDPAIISIYPTIVNGETDEFIWLPDAAIQHIEGEDEDGNRFASLAIDTSYMPEGVCCFYVKWHLYYQLVAYAPFSACVVNKISLEAQTELQAIHNCLEELVDPENIEVSVDEPFCEEKCRPTIVVQGEYPDKDCNGNYYGLIGGNPNPFLCKFRIHGEIAQQGYNFEETNINGRKKSSKQVSTWLLRTPKIPPYMADKLAVAFNSELLTINGAEFRKAEELSKNNEDGYMWIINTTLTTECDEINFTCH